MLPSSKTPFLVLFMLSFYFPIDGKKKGKEGNKNQKKWTKTIIKKSLFKVKMNEWKLEL